MLESIMRPIAHGLLQIHAHLAALAVAARRAESTLRSADVHAGLYGVDTAIERAWAEACRVAEASAITALEAQLSLPGLPLQLPPPRIQPPRFDSKRDEPADQAFIRTLTVALERIKAETTGRVEALAWEQLARRVSAYWRLYTAYRHKPAWRQLGSRHAITTAPIGRETAGTQRHLQDMNAILHREGNLGDPVSAAAAAIAVLDAGTWRTDTKLRASVGGHIEVRLYDTRTDWVLSDAAFAAVNLLIAEREREAA